MNQEEAMALVKKHGNKSAAARAVGIPKTTFYEIISGVNKHHHQTHKASSVAPTGPTKRAGRSLAEFRQTFDKDLIVPSRIKAALAALGSDGWDYEVGFAKLAGLNLSDLGNYREKFIDYVVPIRERRAWAGSKSLAEKMRSMV